MKYEKIVPGIFLSRPNRFIAKVLIEGKEETVHVKNTGRCKELLIPGVKVIMEDFRGRAGSRKTLFDLIAVYKNSATITENGGQGFEGQVLDSGGQVLKKPLLINMDSQAPNKVVYEWLCKKDYDLIQPEYTYGNSRVDFYMEKKIENTGDRSLGDRSSLLQSDFHTQKYLLEVKGCTLEENGTGYFPDAPTLRGVKHLQELAKAQGQGIKCFLAFVIQIPGVKMVYPNIKTHPEFADALEAAKKSGVEILYLQCDIKEDQLNIIN